MPASRPGRPVGKAETVSATFGELCRATSEGVEKTMQGSDSDDARIFYAANTVLTGLHTLLSRARGLYRPPWWFVGDVVGLVAAGALLHHEIDESWPPETWPITPGTTVFWRAGDSVVNVLSSLWQEIDEWAVFDPAKTRDLPTDEDLQSDAVEDWIDQVASKTADRMPPLPWWPLWQIDQERERCASLLRMEARHCRDGGPRQQLPIFELGTVERRILRHLINQGVTSEHADAKPTGEDLFAVLLQSRGSITPLKTKLATLVKLGFLRNANPGYYVTQLGLLKMGDDPGVATK